LPPHIALGAILETLADILRLFRCAVLPWMQDGVIAAVTAVTHSDHDVRKVCCAQILKHVAVAP